MDKTRALRRVSVGPWGEATTAVLSHTVPKVEGAEAWEVEEFPLDDLFSV